MVFVSISSDDELMFSLTQNRYTEPVNLFSSSPSVARCPLFKRT
jgi:hypothetical protein